MTSTLFFNSVVEDLEKFLSANTFTIENIERYFNLNIGIVSNLRSDRRRKGYSCNILKKPTRFYKSIFFEDIRGDKKYENHPDRDCGIMLLFHLSLEKLRNCFTPVLEVENLAEALLFYGIESDFQVQSCDFLSSSLT